MIDYKIGDKTTNNANLQMQENANNYNEENILAQIRHLRNTLCNYEEIKIKQRRYTNIILTIILILIFFLGIPTFLEIIIILNGFSNL